VQDLSPSDWAPSAVPWPEVASDGQDISITSLYLHHFLPWIQASEEEIRLAYLQLARVGLLVVALVAPGCCKGLMVKSPLPLSLPLPLLALRVAALAPRPSSGVHKDVPVSKLGL
jgi:hypothetical protein